MSPVDGAKLDQIRAALDNPKAAEARAALVQAAEAFEARTEALFAAMRPAVDAAEWQAARNQWLDARTALDAALAAARSAGQGGV